MNIANVLLSLFIFCIIVTFHEFGHFLLAKLNGVGVEEFAIGFGPKLISKKYKDTIYSIRLIPLGGFCAMVGEKEFEDEDTKPSKPKKSLFKKKQSQNEEENKIEKTEEEKEDTKKETISKKEIDMNKAFSNKKLWQKFLIVLAGPVFNFILAFIVAIIYITFFGSPHPADIGEIVEGLPAAESEMQVGDRIIAANGRHISSFQDLHAYTSIYQNKTITFDAIRNGEKVRYTITPAYNKEYNKYIFGFRYTDEYITEGRSVFDIIKMSYYECRYYARMVYDSFYLIAHKDASINDMSSIVGVVDMMDTGMEEVKETGGTSSLIGFCLFFTVLLSMNLGIMNLLPIPALDGGRLFIYIIEGFTRKPIPPKIENALNTIGFILLFGLMIYLTINDVFKIAMR